MPIAIPEGRLRIRGDATLKKRIRPHKDCEDGDPGEYGNPDPGSSGPQSSFMPTRRRMPTYKVR